jgi:hypothetical protein
MTNFGPMLYLCKNPYLVTLHFGQLLDKTLVHLSAFWYVFSIFGKMYSWKIWQSFRVGNGATRWPPKTATK